MNIKEIKGKNYVKELVDSIGRTKQLEFYNTNGHLDYPGSGYYGSPIIKYHYEPKSIIETAYISDIDLANDFMFSEVPNQIVYDLNNSGEIENTTFRYKVEFNLDKEQIDKIIENFKLYRNLIPETGMESYTMDSVFGYQFASGKLKGFNPKRNK
ncbi:hypothetical protein [Croceibacter atlanticus]|uniref:hypothetical protein n=1 Tax=Croceibacter atlanticus TaxID=313588 RepID=UPI0024BAD9BB|nr:hypothetical protein [Croceibacter atlanticus]